MGVYEIKVTQSYIPYKIKWNKKIEELPREISGSKSFFTYSENDDLAILTAQGKSDWLRNELFPYGNFDRYTSGYTEIKDIELEYEILSSCADAYENINTLKKELTANEFINYLNDKGCRIGV